MRFECPKCKSLMSLIKRWFGVSTRIGLYERNVYQCRTCGHVDDGRYPVRSRELPSTTYGIDKRG